MTERQIDLPDGYWKRLLGDFPLAVNLPQDRPRHFGEQVVRQTVNFNSGNSDQASAISRAAKSSGATDAEFVLAVCNCLLARYCDQRDIVLCARLPLPSVLDHPLIVRTDVAPELSFVDLLARTSASALSAAEQPADSFIQLLNDFRPDFKNIAEPVFKIGFSVLGEETQHRDASLQSHPLLAASDLHIVLKPTPQGVAGQIEFNASIFNLATIERMAGHYTSLLDAAAHDPGQNILRMPWLSSEESDTLLHSFNDTATDYPKDKTVCDLFLECVDANPGAEAVVGKDGRSLSYTELDKASNQLAHYLRNLHQQQGVTIGKGESNCIGVYLERDIEMLVALHAIHKCGAAYVPLDPMFPPERLALMAEDAQLSVIVTQQSLLDSVPGTNITAIPLDTLQAELQACPAQRVCNATPSGTAYVIFTSGSTGRPKGVSVGHQALTNFLVSVQKDPGFDEKDRLLSVTTLSFDVAVMELFLPMISGGCVVLASREEAMDPERLSSRIQDSGASFMVCTIATWRMLLDNGWSGAPDLRIVTGGEDLPRDLANSLIPLCKGLWNYYGPTETTISSTGCRVVPGDEPISIGKPIANTQVYVLNEQQEIQPIGLRGELYIGGDSVSQGYRNRPELTAERFVPDTVSGTKSTVLYRTGDAARWREDGSLELLGRLDEQVKLRGFRIEPGEIAVRLREHPGVKDAVVILREDSPGDTRLTAYLVLDSMAHLSPALLRDALKADLPEYMIPTAWVQLESFPVTPNGKVDKQSLPVPDTESLLNADEETRQLPETPTEITVSGVWQNLLGVGAPGRDENFFSLGGNSLKAIQLVSRFRNEFQVEIPLLSIFEHPTIAELASDIDQQIAAAGMAPVAQNSDDNVGFEL